MVDWEWDLSPGPQQGDFDAYTDSKKLVSDFGYLPIDEGASHGSCQISIFPS